MDSANLGENSSPKTDALVHIKRPDHARQTLLNEVTIMDSRYILGIDELDHQHEEIEAAFEAVRNAKGNEKQWIELHAKLCEQLRFHFHAEESVMKIFAYPETFEHARSHSMIVRSIEGYKGQNLSESDMEKFDDQAKQLFLEQILSQDMRFADYIKRNKERLGLQ